ncbi:MAG: alpha/beta fold hydrolase [Chloroflexi bacterium]|nr:alpha/beta fold hydrolase [Chloroflexota bacterium]
MTAGRQTVPNGAISLQGELHLPSEGTPPYPGIVVCHPHPTYGGSMDNNVVMAVIAGVTKRGIAALRFNFRGVGDSTGAYDGHGGEQDDVAAAVAYLLTLDEIDAHRVGLAGYSFGAMMAMGAAPHLAEVKALALVALPTTSIVGPEQEAGQVSAGEGMEHYSKPKLFLAGDRDSFVAVDAVRELTQRLLPPTELHVLAGGDHFLVGHEEEIAERIGEFFARGLASSTGSSPSPVLH